VRSSVDRSCSPFVHCSLKTLLVTLHARLGRVNAEVNKGICSKTKKELVVTSGNIYMFKRTQKTTLQRYEIDGHQISTEDLKAEW